jgi:hypothetical protein
LVTAGQTERGIAMMGGHRPRWQTRRRCPHHLGIAICKPAKKTEALKVRNTDAGTDSAADPGTFWSILKSVRWADRR